MSCSNAGKWSRGGAGRSAHRSARTLEVGCLVGPESASGNQPRGRDVPDDVALADHHFFDRRIDRVGVWTGWKERGGGDFLNDLVITGSRHTDRSRVPAGCALTVGRTGLAARTEKVGGSGASCLAGDTGPWALVRVVAVGAGANRTQYLKTFRQSWCFDDLTVIYLIDVKTNVDPKNKKR